MNTNLAFGKHIKKEKVYMFVPDAIFFEENVKEYESDPKKIIRYSRLKLCDL